MQASQPITAVPNYGGSDGHGATGFQIMGDGPVPTPKQLVEQLDQYVIGQKQAKKVCYRIQYAMLMHDSGMAESLPLCQAVCSCCIQVHAIA